MREQVTQWARLIYDADAADSIVAQADAIAEDMTRLFDVDSTTGVELVQMLPLAIQSEAGDRDTGGRPPISRHGFERFEVRAAHEYTDASGRSYCEAGREPHGPNPSPRFWTVYGRGSDGLAQAVGDFATAGLALVMADRLADGRAVDCVDSMCDGFRVSFEIVTQESAEHGDADSRGWIGSALGMFPQERAPEPCGLSRAVAMVTQTRTSRVDGATGIEPDSSDWSQARAVTVYNGAEYKTGAHESRTLHFPESMTALRRRALCALLCA